MLVLVILATRKLTRTLKINILITVIVICASNQTVNSKEIPVQPGNSTLIPAYENTASKKDILILEKGVYELMEDFIIKKEIEIRGHNYGKDAKKRSLQGVNDFNHTGIDIEESVIMANTTENFDS